MSEKRIQFTGVDAGVSQMMSKLRQSAKDIGNDMISEARGYSQQAKEQLGFLDDQIKAIERRNRLEREGQELKARQTLSGDALQKEIQKITLESRQDDFQTKLLRELIETIKITSKEEISEDRKNIEGRISAFKKDPSQFTPEDQLKISYQKELLDQDRKSKEKSGIMGDVFTGTFLANAFQGILSNIASISSARDEEQAIGSLLGAIPFVGGILGSTYGRAREEQYNYELSGAKVRGLSGKPISTVGQFNQFGFSGTESMNMLEGAFTAAGTSKINTSDYLAAGRAFSLDQGTLNDRLNVGRFSLGGQSGFLSELTKILKASGLENDRVLFGEILKNQTSLVKDFSNTVGVVDQNIVTDRMMSYNNVGGMFSLKDPRSTSLIRQVNQSLANPGNDLMQAENIAILRGINPNAGVFDIKKMEEQGDYTPDFLKGVLSNIESRFGGDDQYAKLALKRRLNLNYEATEQLYNNREAIISGNASIKDIQGMTSKQVNKEAELSTAKLDVSAAKISDAFVDNLGSGLLEIAGQVGGKIGETFLQAVKLAGIEIKEPNKNINNNSGGNKAPYNGIEYTSSGIYVTP